MTAYIHHIPGRVRVRIARLKGSERFALEIEQHLRSQRGVRTAVANPLTGNVLIHYDPTLTDITQFTPALEPYEGQISRNGSARSLPEKDTGPKKGPGQTRVLAYFLTRAIVSSLIETAIQRAVVGVIAAVL